MKYGCSISDRVAQKGKFAERYEPRDADRFKKCTSIYFVSLLFRILSSVRVDMIQTHPSTSDWFRGCRLRS